MRSSLSIRSRARCDSPTMASAETSQKEQMRKVPSSPREAVVGLLRPVAEREAVLGEILRDGEHGGAQALVVGRKEPEDRRQERGGVERVGCVVLTEDARSLTPCSRMSALISSAVAPHFACSSASPRISASFAARSSATQHMSFEET